MGEAQRRDVLDRLARTALVDDRRYAEARARSLAERGAVISNGYGILKNETFRIAHMGEIRDAEIEELLSWIDEILGLDG